MTDKTTAARVALVTGGSAGLGLALCRELAGRGWRVITDGRSEEKFKEADLPDAVTVVVGDLTDADHRQALVGEVSAYGRLDLLVHNASTLGPLPMRPLAEVDIADLQQVWRTNIGGPLVLTSALLPWLREANGVLLSISSDAAVHHYEGWGLYGASKAALDHVTLTYGAETGLRAYAVDPGDMRTAMHQDAFPGEDISDRPLPETVVPHLVALLDERPASGRYRAADLGGDVR
ncbi:SDR family oxidoreductase [Nocardioides ganghwensis]|jgi:NAD(P)-dependent dehydrogenase (short-subunit alcohol dehydrogenase family)|uniref:SDR family oxidoreductase n=1 Tax=Nocardioides ganghwensis TaxID=252230 RepID=A0A4V1RMQ6_9ACTN|nr:SDR family oxidoreductase [Nocardioides ganghwensis]MBD3946435.1 SDR family oxidoreductase [Nocardioides ganghwensis]RYC03187.1 SDR family oxidoreductase [Nocardioides ganghwensis]